MEEKIALVTGGGTGIGAACCRSLSDAGFKVGIHYNSSKVKAEELAASLPNCFIIQGDVSTVEGIDSVYDVIKKDHNGQVDVLVNNAGIALDNPIFSANLDDFQKTMDINVRGTWYMIKRIARFMIRKKSGRIINISSVIGSVPNPTQSVYGMTKAAIDNLTKVAAIELAQYNILVNSVAPGFIDTDMTKKIPEELQKEIFKKIPLGRMGQPEEVGDVVKFLATSGTYITGSIIHVNGGMYG
ncbi:MAG: 3-oxoacyl-ACP reductase FabG [Spirochaetia bacterium]|nr:3-oxoacyl-ACP reductase FabG [Spirochaetia bacterium]